MLRKRTRSDQRDQLTNNSMACAVPSPYFQSDISNQTPKSTNPFLNVPGLFGGFNRKSSESDSSSSPTSPLDFRIFSGFGNALRHARASPSEGSPKSWDCQKVGLSTIGSLDEAQGLGNVTESSKNKSILFGRQMSIRCLDPCNHVDFVETLKSLPENIPARPHNVAKPPNVPKGNSSVVFEIGDAPEEPESDDFHAHSLDSGSYGSSLTNLVLQNAKNPTPSEPGFLGGSLNSGGSCLGKLSSYPFSVQSGTYSIGSVPAGNIKLSEDYTCVRTHGPNPKVIHIYGDCILGCHSDHVTDSSNESEDGDASPEAGGPVSILASYPCNGFLKFCYFCQKKLDGQDIFMYRGEKAFCSHTCRLQEIETDEDMEKIDADTSELSS